TGRMKLTESSERLSVYWKLWTLLMNKADRPDTTKDYDLVDIGAGSGFGFENVHLSVAKS
ncbi:MAG: hypothetical protein ACI956_001701, partial [Nonlabens sp.]